MVYFGSGKIIFLCCAGQAYLYPFPVFYHGAGLLSFRFPQGVFVSIMQKNMRPVIVFILAACILGVARGQDWQLRSDKEGIRTYSRAEPGSRIRSIRIESEINADAPVILSVIANTASYDEWVYGSRHTRLIKQVSAFEWYYYSELSFPWPASNRDFVSHVRISQDPATKIISVTASNVPGWEPVHAHLVRMYFGQGQWEIIPVANKKVLLKYTLRADPAGELPAWIINAFISKGPFSSFRNLKTYLQNHTITPFPLPYPME